MLYAYIGIECIVILLIVVCLLGTKKNNSEIKQELSFLLRIGIYTMFFHIIYVTASVEIVAVIGYSMFSAMIDWLLFAMLYFSFAYTHKINHNKWHYFSLVFVGSVDTISMMMNVATGHVLKMEEYTILDKYTVYKMVDSSAFYTFHLAYCYLLVLGIIFLLIRQFFLSSTCYRKRYSGVLGLFVLVVILDGLSVYMRIAMNVSILFYGALTLAIYYFTVRYIPGKLVRQMQNLMMDKLGSGIICFDETGKFIYANDSLWALWGVQPNIPKAEMLYLEFWKQKKMFDSDNTKWRDSCVVNGVKRYLEVTSQSMYDTKHHFMGCYFCVYDRTEQKKFFDKRIQQEKDANRAKSAFLSMVSHEIRTPVNSIYGMSEMILRECEDSEILQYAAQIKTASDTLIGIINDVLDFSKIDAGRMEIVKREFNMEKLLRNIYYMTKIKANEKNLQFILQIASELPTSFVGDDVRLEQVMMNLLSNAIKYTPEGSVTLKLNWEQRDDIGCLGIYVQDTGIGIKNEDMPKLFEVFQRLDQTKNHGIQGTGLGLNITHQLLKLMGSELKVESEYGKGSTFYAVIPIEVVDVTPLKYNPEGKQQVEKVEYAPSFVAKDANILVVDDNKINRMVFKNLVKKTLVQVHEAESGSECLKMIQENHFDLIFMDHMMPEMDGIETFRRMKEMEHRCQDVPVIMLTANAIDGAMQEYLEQGFSDFLSKPIIPEALESMMQKYLKQNDYVK